MTLLEINEAHMQLPGFPDQDPLNPSYPIKRGSTLLGKELSFVEKNDGSFVETTGLLDTVNEESFFVMNHSQLFMLLRDAKGVNLVEGKEVTLEPLLPGYESGKQANFVKDLVHIDKSDVTWSLDNGYLQERKSLIELHLDSQKSMKINITINLKITSDVADE